jgi:hypothetical protein
MGVTCRVLAWRRVSRASPRIIDSEVEGDAYALLEVISSTIDLSGSVFSIYFV